jgi:hypothetical protein
MRTGFVRLQPSEISNNSFLLQAKSDTLYRFVFLGGPSWPVEFLSAS